MNWISVDERWPGEEDHRRLCFVADSRTGGTAVFEWVWDGYDGYFSVVAGDGGHIGQITHWMRPAPPET